MHIDYNAIKIINYHLDLSGNHVRFFGINILGCIFCRLSGCSGFGARTELEVPSVSAGLLIPETAVSSTGGMGGWNAELVG